MAIALEIGRRYRLRDGSIVGPTKQGENLAYPYRIDGVGSWRANGSYSAHGKHSMDIVALAESPVRTVTRTDIVPGIYGIIHLLDSSVNGAVHIGANPCHAGPDELREAARIFTEIADAIDAGAST